MGLPPFLGAAPRFAPRPTTLILAPWTGQIWPGRRRRAIDFFISIDISDCPRDCVAMGLAYIDAATRGTYRSCRQLSRNSAAWGRASHGAPAPGKTP